MNEEGGGVVAPKTNKQLHMQFRRGISGVLEVWKREDGTSSPSSYNGNFGVYSLLILYAVWTGK